MAAFLSENVQVLVLFVLQKLCFHTAAFLVCLLWLLYSGLFLFSKFINEQHSDLCSLAVLENRRMLVHVNIQVQLFWKLNKIIVSFLLQKQMYLTADITLNDPLHFPS